MKEKLATVVGIAAELSLDNKDVEQLDDYGDIVDDDVPRQTFADVIAEAAASAASDTSAAGTPAVDTPSVETPAADTPATGEPDAGALMLHPAGRRCSVVDDSIAIPRTRIFEDLICSRWTLACGVKMLVFPEHSISHSERF